jgi:hypothetical protein
MKKSPDRRRLDGLMRQIPIGRLGGNRDALASTLGTNFFGNFGFEHDINWL